MSRKNWYRFLRRIGGKILYLFCFLDQISSSQTNLLRKFTPEKKIDYAKKICLFIAYEIQNDLGYLNEMFKEIESLGFKIVIINNTNYQDIKVNVLNRKIYSRGNLGLDLAAARDGFRTISDLPEELLVLNDSVFYFPGGIKKILGTAERIDSDVVGLTESFQKIRHFQSYFFYSKSKVGIDALVLEYENMKNWRFKRSAVAFGELRILKNLERRGVRCEAVAPYKDLETEARINPFLVESEVLNDISKGLKLNPTQQLWKVLLYQGIPLVKKSLIFSNPARLKYGPSSYSDAQQIYYSINRYEE